MENEVGVAVREAIIKGDVSEMTRILTDSSNENLSVNTFIGDYVKGSGEFLEPTALTVAVEHNQIECVRKILELGGRLYTVGTTEDEMDDLMTAASIYLSEDYYIALVIAASKGFHEILHLLIVLRLFKVPELLDDFDEFIRTVKDCDFQRIQILLDLVCDKEVVLKGWKGHNIMNLCLLHGCPPSCVQTLIDNGIGVNGWDYNGMTPLMCAILGKNLECVQFLLEKGANPYAIHILRRISFQEDGTVLFMNDMGQEMNPQPVPNSSDGNQIFLDHVGPPVLMYAAAVGNIPILKLMLEAAPKDIGNSARIARFDRIGPLMFAVDYANIEAVQLILQYDAAKIGVSEIPLCHAICDGNSELVEVLLENTSVWEHLALSLAILKCVHKKNSFLLSKVLSCYVEEDLFELDDGRALFSAIADDACDCVDIIIKRPEFSVDLKCTSKYFFSACGLTGFMFSCRKGRLELARKFLDMGANVNALDHTGKTAAMFAVRHDQVDSLKFLMDIADFDSVDYLGGTVFSASLVGDGRCLEVLIKTGKVLDEKGLKLVHKQSLKVYGDNLQDDGFGDYKKTIPSHNILLLMQHKIFDWDWCTMVDRKSLYNFIFAAVTSGTSPGKIAHHGALISPFTYALLIEDVAILRYLVANMYFLRNDYKPLQTTTSKLNGCPELTFFVEQLTLQPLTLQTWSALTILERVSFSDSYSILGDRNSRVDKLPLPVSLKDVLQSKTKYYQLCPRHWKRLGPQMNENKGCQFDFDVLSVNGNLVRYPALEPCAKPFCLCGGRGMSLKDLDGDTIEDHAWEGLDDDEVELADFEFEDEDDEDDDDD